eukprot:1279548-Prymnesium_polylepis.1
MEARIRKTLESTKFHDAPIVGVAARPGGAASAGEDTEVRSAKTRPDRAACRPLLASRWRPASPD